MARGGGGNSRVISRRRHVTRLDVRLRMVSRANSCHGGGGGGGGNSRGISRRRHVTRLDVRLRMGSRANSCHGGGGGGATLAGSRGGVTLQSLT